MGAGIFRQGFVGLEVAVGAVAASVGNTPGNPLAVKMEDLLVEMKILNQGRSALADLERILVVRHKPALRNRQYLRAALCNLRRYQLSDQAAAVGKPVPA